MAFKLSLPQMGRAPWRNSVLPLIDRKVGQVNGTGQTDTAAIVGHMQGNVQGYLTQPGTPGTLRRVQYISFTSATVGGWFNVSVPATLYDSAKWKPISAWVIKDGVPGQAPVRALSTTAIQIWTSSVPEGVTFSIWLEEYF